MSGLYEGILNPHPEPSYVLADILLSGLVQDDTGVGVLFFGILVLVLIWYLEIGSWFFCSLFCACEVQTCTIILFS